MNPQVRFAMIFYVITLGFAIGVRLLVPFVAESSALLTMLTPALATVIMLITLDPATDWRRALVDLGMTRLGLKAWPLAILGPTAILFAGLIVLVGLGYTAITGLTGSASIGSMALNLLAGLAVGTALAFFEEIGWRGYMLPRMAAIGAVPAMLALGFLQGVWHLPLLLTTEYYHSTGNPWIVAPMFLVTLTLAGVFFGFLRVWSGSIWPVALAHTAVNFSWNISAELSETQSPIVLEYIGGESGAVMIIGLAIADLLLLRALANRQFTRGA